MIAGSIKALWLVIVLGVLASGEPFWHQALLVLGGAAITSGSVIAAAWITARHAERPVREMQQELAQHREIVEGNGSDDEVDSRP